MGKGTDIFHGSVHREGRVLRDYRDYRLGFATEKGENSVLLGDFRCLCV